MGEEAEELGHEWTRIFTNEEKAEKELF